MRSSGREPAVRYGWRPSPTIQRPQMSEAAYLLIVRLPLSGLMMVGSNSPVWRGGTQFHQ